MVRNKAIYLALGVLPDGTRDILGLWIEGTKGAKFWMAGAAKHHGEWCRAAHNWKEEMNQFAILYEDRFTKIAA